MRACGCFPRTTPRGAVLDGALYEQVPKKAALLTRSYTALPGAASLKAYAPYPGNQGRYGTCTGWSSAYAARTISESVALNRLDRFLTTSSVFSPVFMYKSAFLLFKNNGNPTGHEGAAISWVLDAMKREGAVKMQDFERAADFPRIALAAFAGSPRFPIAGYVALFPARWGRTGGRADRGGEEEHCRREAGYYRHELPGLVFQGARGVAA